jgi:hypothetical protein
MKQENVLGYDKCVQGNCNQNFPLKLCSFFPYILEEVHQIFEAMCGDLGASITS